MLSAVNAWFHAAGNRTRQEVSYEGSAAGQASVGGAKAGAEHPLDLLRWFKEAERDYSDGASYAKYLKNIRTDAIAMWESAWPREKSWPIFWLP